jgi:predicted nucleic acid-binding protein
VLILVDTSVWIDYLNEANTVAVDRLDALLQKRPEDVFLCEPIVMELLAGAREGIQLTRLEVWTQGIPLLPIDAKFDFRQAASIFRAMRRKGFTIRSMIDCLIAAIAIRHDAQLVHKDSDYDYIAHVMDLNALSWNL